MRSTSSGVLIVGGVDSSTSTVGSGAWWARARPSTRRRIPSSSCCRTDSEKARSVSWSLTSSGMMLCLVPPWIEPTVRTAGSPGAISRLTIVWRSTTTQRREDDRVDRAVRPGAMSPLAADDDRHRRRAGQHGTGIVLDRPGRLVGGAMEGQGEVGPGESRIEPVREHRAGTPDGLLGGLGDQEHGPRPSIPVIGQPSRGADETRHVHVVAAGVHHADGASRLVGGLLLAGIGEARLLGDGQRIHVGPDQDDGPRPVLEDSDHADLSDPRGDFRPRLRQLGGDPPGGLVLLERQLGVGMEMLVEGIELVDVRGDPGIAG